MDFLGSLLRIFWEYFGGFFGRNFLGKFFWEDFWEEFFGEDFFGRIFWEEFFGRNYLVEINKVLMFLSRFWGNARRRKEEEFRSLEVRGKPIALKKNHFPLILPAEIILFQSLNHRKGNLMFQRLTQIGTREDTFHSLVVFESDFIS